MIYFPWERVAPDFTNSVKKSKSVTSTSAPAPLAEKGTLVLFFVARFWFRHACLIYTDPIPSAASTAAPAAVPPAAKSSATGPDLNALFSQSPLLTNEDKTSIELFFSENCKSSTLFLFMRGSWLYVFCAMQGRCTFRIRKKYWSFD